ncbi:SH3 domain-containing protein [Taibaiella chishuiensis]|uniref:SH3 domain-containing protein n=1 Tax=Taibaiella chishuiensis TaxID=1434707 RepID=A0A2P8D4M3_9BACT|nr:SH3 domain-containing protein [Taibaiella chishuiensis]PSK92171.1 SH3 domain-containing protein [Taibaiella chishuiensis]
MKCKNWLPLLAVLVMSYAPQLHAQSAGQGDYNAWEANPGDTFYVYGRMANVRSQAGADAAVIDSLPCGAPVIIQEQGKELYALKNIYAPWMKVKYHSGAILKEGYIWEGLLALGSYRDQDTRFVYGMEKVLAKREPKPGQYEPEQWLIRLKALDAGGQLLDEREWKTASPETSMTSGKLLGDMGLPPLRNIVRISVGGGACAIPADYYYYGWTGAGLLPLPGKTEVGDAGIYYFVETLLFPSEPGGQPGKIIRLTEEGEARDKPGKNGEPVFKVRKKRQVYHWDGAKAILQK